MCTAHGLCSSFFPHSLSTLVTHSAPQEIILWASSEALPSGKLKPDEVQWQWGGDPFLLFPRVGQQHLLSAPLDSLLGGNCGGQLGSPFRAAMLSLPSYSLEPPHWRQPGTAYTVYQVDMRPWGENRRMGGGQAQFGHLLQ